MRHLVGLPGLLAAAIALAPGARAELDLDIAFGTAHTASSQVELSRPGPTALNFDAVSWEDSSFEGPMYYQVRFTYWSNRREHWGISLDFTHAKAEGEVDRLVDVSGIRDGQPVSGQELVADTFDRLTFSHGHNMLTVNGNYRFGAPSRRIRPYLGFGAGAALPRVEVRVEDSITDEYQAAGPTLLVLGGVDLEALRWLTFALEYKLSYSSLDADLVDGGSLQTDLWTHHVTVGASFRFGKPKN